MDDLLVGGEKRVVDTPYLESILTGAMVEDYNRQPGNWSLAPGGVHIVSPLLVHKHRHGEPYKEHMRVILMLKIVNQDEPYTTGPVDIRMDDFMSLPSVTDVKAAWDAGNMFMLPGGTYIQQSDQEE